MSLLRDFVKSRLNPPQSSDASAAADQADVGRAPASTSGDKPTTGPTIDPRQVDSRCQVPPTTPHPSTPESIKPPSTKPSAQDAVGTHVVPSQTRVIVME